MDRAEKQGFKGTPRPFNPLLSVPSESLKNLGLSCAAPLNFIETVQDSPKVLKDEEVSGGELNIGEQPAPHHSAVLCVFL